jgi:PAS domain-containing protein
MEAGLDVFFDPSDTRLVTALEEQHRTGKFKGELFLLRGNGLPFSAEVSIGGYRGENGKDLTNISFRDISERKRAEEELRRSEAQFRAMVENALDLIAL